MNPKQIEIIKDFFEVIGDLEMPKCDGIATVEKFNVTTHDYINAFHDPDTFDAILCRGRDLAKEGNLKRVEQYLRFTMYQIDQHPTTINEPIETLKRIDCIYGLFAAMLSQHFAA